MINLNLNTRVDTGWDCCICNATATVLGDGFTWCKSHWEEFGLGRKSDNKGMWSIVRMRDREKEKMSRMVIDCCSNMNGHELVEVKDNYGKPGVKLSKCKYCSYYVYSQTEAKSDSPTATGGE